MRIKKKCNLHSCGGIIPTRFTEAKGIKICINSLFVDSYLFVYIIYMMNVSLVACLLFILQLFFCQEGVKMTDHLISLTYY